MSTFFMSPPHRDFHLQGRANFRSGAAIEVDAAAAGREWLALAEAIEALGGQVVVLPAPDELLTGMPFAAEAGQPLPPSKTGGAPRFLLPRMKPEHRKTEREHWGPFMASQGFELVDLAVGFWEGQGDVAFFDGVTLLFYGSRSDKIGMQAARAHFPGEVLEIEIREPAFHGNMAVLPLDHVDRLLVSADVIEDDALAMLEARFGRDRMHLVSQAETLAYANNALPVGDTLLAPAALPQRVQKLLEREGMKVVTIPMPELCGKAGGASRCLVCVYEGELPAAAPHRLGAVRASLGIG